MVTRRKEDFVDAQYQQWKGPSSGPLKRSKLEQDSGWSFYKERADEIRQQWELVNKRHAFLMNLIRAIVDEARELGPNTSLEKLRELGTKAAEELRETKEGIEVMKKRIKNLLEADRAAESFLRETSGPGEIEA